MDTEVHQHPLRRCAAVHHLKSQNHFFADGRARGRDLCTAHGHIGLRAEAQHGQGSRLPAFDGRAQGVAHDPLAFLTRTLQPLVCGAGQHLRVVLADVVQVVGDRAAHIQRRVVLEQFQQRQHGCRVFLERGQAGCPGQARAGAFRHETAHMFTRVLCPLAQPRQRGGFVLHQKRPDAELGSEALCQRVLGVHRGFEVRQSVMRHQRGVGQEQESGHRAANVFAVGRVHRVQQDTDGFLKIFRQMATQHMGDMVATWHQLQCLVAV